MKKVTWNQVYQIWSWYVVFIQYGPLGDRQICLKRTFEESQILRIWSRYIVFIKHSPERDNYIKIFKNSFWKEFRKSFSCSYFDSLIPAVFHTVKIFIFQDSFCCNFFIRFYRIQSYIQDPVKNLFLTF